MNSIRTRVNFRLSFSPHGKGGSVSCDYSAAGFRVGVQRAASTDKGPVSHNSDQDPGFETTIIFLREPGAALADAETHWEPGTKEITRRRFLLASIRPPD